MSSKSKKHRWMKGLSRKLVDSVMKYEPREVKFVIEYPDYIKCVIITTNKEIGVGYAICSFIDCFDEKTGKNRACGRAVKALSKKENTELVRQVSECPNTWLLAQARHLNDVGNRIAWMKSRYDMLEYQ